MKSRSTTMHLALVAAVFAISVIPATSQSTWTCTVQGEYDMLSLMFMQKSFRDDNYYLKGNSYTWQGGEWKCSNDTNPCTAWVYHNDVPQVSTYTGPNNSEWATGKINMVKDFQGAGNGTEGGATTPPYWGYPWDINLFDIDYVYLWITEYAGTAEWWGDAYAYKAFNNGSTNNTMRFTNRCVVPGDNGTTSQLVNGTSGTYTTDFFFVPADGDSPTYTSTDCGTKSAGPNLGYAIITVGAVQPYSQTDPYILNNTLTGQPIDLSIVPVTYQYNCGTDSGNCGNEEVYEYGFDSAGNNYGLVQWASYTSPSKNSQYTTPVSLSVFNNIYQWSQTDLENGKGGTTVSFPCNPI